MSIKVDLVHEVEYVHIRKYYTKENTTTTENNVVEPQSRLCERRTQASSACFR